MERDHLITNTVFNISSDLMILALPMPVFLKAQLPPKRKAVLVGVFLLGLFTVRYFPTLDYADYACHLVISAFETNM